MATSRITADIPPTASLRELERVKGIEPSSSAWKAVALPLSYTRVTKLFSPPSPDGLRRGSLRSLRLGNFAGLPRRSSRSERRLVGEVGLEPTKAKPADLQ